MGLFAFAVAGGGFILIGAHEAIAASNSEPKSTQNPISSQILNQNQPKSKSNRNQSSNSLSFIFVSFFSFLCVLNSLLSLIDANNSRDRVGSALQLQVIAIALVFLLYSILGLLTYFKKFVPLPGLLLSLIVLFAFVEEFLLFYLQRKDPSGIENRYYGLLLVPITICVFSTILELKSPKSNIPKLARGVGLILQGTWFLQMGMSFFTSWIAHGCFLHKLSRGNYTIRCKGHPDYHRARAIATLQFNGHLALMVIVLVGLYSLIVQKNGGNFDSSKYKPIGEEMQSLENPGQFTLDSDDDFDEEINENRVAKQKATDSESGLKKKWETRSLERFSVVQICVPHTVRNDLKS